MSLDTRLLSINGGTTIVVFSRIDVLNAICENMGDEISKYLESEFENFEEELDNARQECRKLEFLLDIAEYERDEARDKVNDLIEQVEQP